MWTHITTATRKAKSRWDTMNKTPEAGYTTEAVLTTALLVIGALIAIGILMAKVNGAANQIDLGQVISYATASVAR